MLRSENKRKEKKKRTTKKTVTREEDRENATGSLAIHLAPSLNLSGLQYSSSIGWFSAKANHNKKIMKQRIVCYFLSKDGICYELVT